MMWSSEIFFIVFLARATECFVYSCEEIIYTQSLQLMNSDFEQYSTHAYVITQDGFSNWDQLKLINLVLGKKEYSFDDIAKYKPPFVTNDQEGRIPWRISGGDPTKNCDQEFTLILKSDELDVFKTPQKFGKFSELSGVFVVPQCGMWFCRMSMSGEGTVSVYSGAGTGEEEDRYLLESWSCDSVPDWIWSYESVITIECDGSCSYLLQHSSDLTLASKVTVFRQDRIVVLNSGRSTNLQNRKNIHAYVKNGDWEQTTVTVNMNISLDTENNGTVNIQKFYAGPEYPFYNGTYTEVFETDYFEIIWRPTLLEPSQISRNQDNINVEIQLSHEDDACPDRYSMVTDSTNQSWCYIIIWPVPPIQGYTFSDAVTLCNSRGDLLPTVTSDAANYELWVFATTHLALESIWLGIICDTDSNNWMWQNGQDLQYRNFSTDPGFPCSESSHFALDTNEKWGTYKPDTIFSYTVCARGNDHEDVPTISSTTTSITTSAGPPNSGLPLWVIIIIVICAISICGCCIGIIIVSRRKITSLRAEFVKEMHDKVKKQSQRPHSRYYDVPNRNHEWEINRRFVRIDYVRKLGEGAFGSVYLGRVLAKYLPSVKSRTIFEFSAMTNNNDMVAVKMLHENADAQTEREFRAEIELMKNIGYHERLVNMLACVTLSEPILLICEYCANGDLLGYLRQRRQFMFENPEETDSGKVITVKQQLMFAIQIAYGLEFLSSRGYIHRDLAARNIMVDHQECCKIGDFGLGRSVGRENENYHAQGGKLPLKWMSPEAIDKFYFSTATDVWSFGILLFEIVTLGGTPYAGWPAAELLKRLKHGERMEKPDNCSDALYKLMCNCWSENPSNRPIFTNLRKQLGHLLENVNKDDYYLKLNPHAHYYVMESNASY